MDPDPNELLARGYTRETAIRRDALGRWWDGEERITHPGLARAFDAWIDLAPDGRFCLRNAIHWVYVAIEGPPLFVRAARVRDDGTVGLTLSDGRDEALDAATLRQGTDGALYCDARGGTMTARFDRPAAAALEGVLGEDERGIYLDVGGARVRPPVVAEPLTRPAHAGQAA